jgi:gas vesicle protein
MAEKTTGVDFFAGFVVGALVGAAATLLLAPHSGEETRTLIRDKGIELKDQADEMSAEARKRAEDLQAQAKTKADELQTKVKDAVEEGKGAATSKKEELLNKLDEAPVPSQE